MPGRRRVPLLWLTVTLLAGCTAEPTEADLERTLQKELAELEGLTSTMIGAEESARTALKLVAVHKVGCSAEDGQNRYLCDAEVEVDSAEAGRRILPAKLHMKNEKQGWTLVKQMQATPDHQ